MDGHEDVHEEMFEGNPNSADAIEFEKFFKTGLLNETPEVVEYNWKWYASQLQRPGYQLNVALGFYSKEKQVGKSRLWKITRDIFLGHHLTLSCRQHDIFGEFNSSRDDNMLIVVDEYEYKEQYITAIRDAITGDEYLSHSKGDNRVHKTSTHNFVIIFNGEKAVDTVELDQRIVVTQIGMGVRDPKWAHLKDKNWNYQDIAARL